MAYSAIKVIGETAAVYIGGHAVSLIIRSALGGFKHPLAVNCSGLVLAIIWSVYIGWAYKRDSLGSIWVWGRASSESKAGVAVFLIVYIIGRDSLMEYVVSSVQMVFRPLESIRLDMCVLAPFREEIFWRGFLLRRLSPIVGTWQAIAISAVAFGLGHPNVLSATAMGALLGWMYSPLGAGNLYIPMLFHALVNLTSDLPF